MLNNWFKTKKVKCKDGTFRILYRDPGEAFQLFVSDWSQEYNATTKMVEDFEATMSADLKKNVSGFFAEIDHANRSMQLSFSAIYQVFIANPCENDEYLKNNVTDIIKREDALRRAGLEVKHLSELRATGLAEEQLTQEIEKSLARLKTPAIETEARSEIASAYSEVEQWAKKPD